MLISALNMELEAIRTVLTNDVNELTVCADRKRETGVYYTVISIKSGKVSKMIAQRINTEGLFTSNNDFVGSFIYLDTLNLVFHYHKESLLKSREALYAASFADRKAIVMNLLVALAETETTGNIGTLLLNDRNINVGPGGQIYLNYFMDFAQLCRDDADEIYYRNVADCAFMILSREYETKHDRNIEYYPQELRLFYKKIESKIFHSYNHIMTFVRSLPDKPQEERFGVWRLIGRTEGIVNYVKANAMTFFLSVTLIITLGFLANQIYIRVRAGKSTQENTTYVGMDTIGEVYLADENA